MLDQGLVDLSNFFTDDFAGDKGFEPEFFKLFLFIIIMLKSRFFLVEDGVAFKIGVRVVMSSCNDVIDFVEEGGVSLSELDLKFGNFFAHVEFDLSFLEDVVIDGNGLYFILESGELLDLFFDFLFDS